MIDPTVDGTVASDGFGRAGRGRGSRAGVAQMTRPVFLNGRFLHQAVTGVQRFSAEITMAIDQLVLSEQWPETVVLAPGPVRPDAGADAATPYQRLRLRQIGR